MSGKPGRPAEDRLRRQREIFQAASPLIERGVSQFTMRQAAKAAHLSLGGLHHYFPTKHSLALHGVSPAAFARICEEFDAAHGDLELSDPEAFLAAYIEFQVDEATFVRPSVLAALELGVPVFLDEMDRGLSLGLDRFVATLARVVPDADARTLDGLGRALRRTLMASMLDRGITAEQLRVELRAQITGWRAIQRRGDRPAMR